MAILFFYVSNGVLWLFLSPTKGHHEHFRHTIFKNNNSKRRNEKERTCDAQRSPSVMAVVVVVMIIEKSFHSL